MNPSASQIAASFNAPPALVPYLAELLADLSALGSDPDLVVAWLRSRGVGPDKRVLDLGCGKGAVSVAVAAALGATVQGVDAYAPFIDEARRLAGERGVSALCDFRVGNLRDVLAGGDEYDAVLYLSVGDVLGTPRETVGALRRGVRKGGLMVINEACRLAGPIDFPGYAHLLGHEDTLAQLTAHGDRLLAERLVTPEEMRAQNRSYQSCIERRGRALGAREPGLARDIDAYVAAQRRECAILERNVQVASWLLERL
jgi:SAM-dependent methyltransferase